MYVCTPHVYIVCGSQKVSDLLGLEVQRVLSLYIGSEKQIWVLWKSINCS